ncbi:MAG: tRNA (adenosine(37)-N6)-threonylcarbamoyltransferase complex transferase subunit TsaD [Phycisphaerae bacterium]|nr:tRNA (adenosine(37)-N6)-threonylcarbamoyltransferase complex transferase subunit TsaD [Phycisphaerales bacterium]
MTRILGIESSCDETAAAVVVNGHDVQSNVVASQVELHRKFGGVVPEIASRAHIECIHNVVRMALEEAKCEPADIDAIAYTCRPGLVGSLLIGATAAKTLGWAWKKPLIAVNHVEAHAVSGSIGVDPAPWPAVALVVSGGHTSLYLVTDFDSVKLLGSTIDDAAGEAFDKVATMLGLGYPGGPVIDRVSASGDPKAHAFPRTLLDSESLDFSFSGLKTAVRYKIHGTGQTTGGLEQLSEKDIADIAASFQQAVVDVLVKKTMRAVAQTGATTVVLGGGVAANRSLRQSLEAECSDRKLAFYAPKMAYCVDNAAMIASLGFHMHAKGLTVAFDGDVCAR